MSRQDIDFKIGADLKQFRSAMGNIDHSLKKMSGGFGALGGVIGATFAVDAIRRFVSESVELAAQAEGVKRAFDRINDPQLLSELRTATKGTLNDLELMKAAVKARNFNIPLKQLGGLLAFAQQRAGETGESIEYMTESIVTGIARKSLPILDNLGFSAVEVREEFNRTGDMAEAVGNIIQRQMSDASYETLTLSEQIAQQRAEIENLKMEVGEQLAPTYKGFLEFVSEGFRLLNSLGSDHLSFVEKLKYLTSFGFAGGGAMRDALSVIKEAREEEAYAWEANRNLDKSNKKLTTSSGQLADTFEKTRNEAFFYTESIHRLKEAHSMLYKAQGAQLQPMVEVTRQLSQAGFDAFTAFDELGNSIGNTLTSSFEAALISGEDFFKVFIQGLKNMLAQLLAAVAAALVLAALLVVITGGGIGALSMQSIGTAFKHFTGPMMGVPSFGLGGGLGGAMQGGGVQVFGRLSGSDILISSERAGRDRTRLSGITG
ncbi:MAG: hypothetical protein VW270_20365 [Candidatus Poseidoniales archaeon]